MSCLSRMEPTYSALSLPIIDVIKRIKTGEGCTVGILSLIFLLRNYLKHFHGIINKSGVPATIAKLPPNIALPRSKATKNPSTEGARASRSSGGPREDRRFGGAADEPCGHSIAAMPAISSCMRQGTEVHSGPTVVFIYFILSIKRKYMKQPLFPL